MSGLLGLVRRKPRISFGSGLIWQFSSSTDPSSSLSYQRINTRGYTQRDITVVIFTYDMREWKRQSCM